MWNILSATYFADAVGLKFWGFFAHHDGQNVREFVSPMLLWFFCLGCARIGRIGLLGFLCAWDDVRNDVMKTSV